MHRGRHKYWECRILTPHAEGRERFPRVTSRGAHDFPTEQTFLVKYSWLVARIVMPRCVSASLLWASCHAAVSALTTACSMRLVERFVTPRCSAVRLFFLRLSRPCVRFWSQSAVCDWWIYMSRHSVWLSVCAGSATVAHFYIILNLEILFHEIYDYKQ